MVDRIRPRARAGKLPEGRGGRHRTGLIASPPPTTVESPALAETCSSAPPPRRAGAPVERPACAPDSKLPQLRVVAPQHGDPRDVPAQYGDWAASYDSDTASYGWCAPRRLLESLTRAAPPQSRLRVLDIGVGTGQASAPYLEAGAQVTGLDIAPEMLEEAHAKHPEFHHLDRYDIDLPISTAGVRPESYDVILSSGTLHFARDLRATLGELARALSPGGVLAFTYIPPQNRKFGTHTSLHAPSEVARMLRELGLQPVEHRPFTAYYDHGNEHDPVTYGLVVARDGRTGGTSSLETHRSVLDRLDRTSSVDRKRITDLIATPLLEGSLRTRRSKHEAAMACAQMRRGLEAQLAEGGEIDPSSIPLPTATDPESLRGGFGCDVLAIFAHPDDETIFVGGTLKALSREGFRIAVLLSTGGDGGRRTDGSIDETHTVRAGELGQALNVLGVERYETLEFADFGKYRDTHRAEPVTAADALRAWGLDALLERLVRAIRTARPRALLSFEPLRDPTFSLHGHHLAVGVAAMLAFHLAADASAYPEHMEEGIRPWAPLRHQVIVPAHHEGQRITSIPISREDKERALSVIPSQRYSTELLMKALRLERPDTLSEKWHLLQARDGGAGRAMRPDSPLADLVGGPPKGIGKAKS